MRTSLQFESLRTAAKELMVESLFEGENDRRIDLVFEDDTKVDLGELAKIAPKRSLAPGYYDFAVYLMWLRSTLECGVPLEVLADEAEGLKAIAAGRQDFERDHPACPRCGARQASANPMFCRACHMNFRKAG